MNQSMNQSIATHRCSLAELVMKLPVSKVTSPDPAASLFCIVTWTMATAANPSGLPSPSDSHVDDDAASTHSTSLQASLALSVFGDIDEGRENRFRRQKEEFQVMLKNFARRYDATKLILTDGNQFRSQQHRRRNRHNACQHNSRHPPVGRQHPPRLLLE